MLGQSGCGQKQQARDAGLSHIKIVRRTGFARKQVNPCVFVFCRFAPNRFGFFSPFSLYCTCCGQLAATRGSLLYLCRFAPNLRRKQAFEPAAEIPSGAKDLFF
jgi:hypothetical protein